MPQPKPTHFVPDETPQYTHFVADESGPSPAPPTAPKMADESGRPFVAGQSIPGDTRNGFQRLVDFATTRDPRREEWQSPAHNAFDAAMQGMTGAVWQPIAHPLQTLKGIGEMLGNVASDPTPMGMAVNLGQPMAEPIVRDFVENGPVYAVPHQLGNLAGGAATAELTGAGAGMAKRAITPYRSAIIPASEVAAERLGKAILPAEGITPNLIRALQREAAQVREYAARTNNPLKTIPEGLKAAQGVAEEGLNHYRTYFLEPYGDVHVDIPSGMSKELGTSTTIRGLDKRISDINDLQRKIETRAKSGGAAATGQEELGLENEAKALRQRLYQALSEKTKVPPEDIQTLREGYGGQFAIKNALESGHYGRMTNAARASQGAPNRLPMSMGEIPGALWRGIQGGPEAIANRQFSRAMSAFEPGQPFRPMPVAPTSPQMSPFSVPEISPDLPERISLWRSEPPPRTMAEPSLNGPMRKAPSVMETESKVKQFQDEARAARQARAEANRQAAQQEVVHSENLKNAAQDAAAQRGERVSGFRQARDKMADAARKLSGETRRSQGRSNFKKEQ